MKPNHLLTLQNREQKTVETLTQIHKPRNNSRTFRHFFVFKIPIHFPHFGNLHKTSTRNSISTLLQTEFYP